MMMDDDVFVRSAFEEEEEPIARRALRWTWRSCRSRTSAMRSLYRIKFGRYPTSAEGLAALAKPPAGKKPLMENVPRDPWGYAYLYLRSETRFVVLSLGPDGEVGTSDDVDPIGRSGRSPP
jgi:hypothetical protein